jgi:hypothetical protein
MDAMQYQRRYRPAQPQSDSNMFRRRGFALRIIAGLVLTLAGSSSAVSLIVAYEGRPAVAFDFGDFNNSASTPKYVMVNEASLLGPVTIQGRIVDIYGHETPLRTIADRSVTVNQTNPTIAFKWGTYSQVNRVYLVAWQDATGKIRYNFLDRNGNKLLTTSSSIVPPADNIYKDPVAASDPYGKWGVTEARMGEMYGGGTEGDAMPCGTFPCDPYLVAYRNYIKAGPGATVPRVQDTQIVLSRISDNRGELFGSTTVEDLDGAPDDPIYAPSLAYGHSSGAGTFVLAYRRLSGEIVIRTVGYNDRGAALVGPPTVVASSSSGRPVVSYGLARNLWLVVWRTVVPGRSISSASAVLKGQFFSTAKDPISLVGSPFTIVSAGIPTSSFGQSFTAADVITDYSVIGGDSLSSASEGWFNVSYSMLNGSYRDIYITNVLTNRSVVSFGPYSVHGRDSRDVASVVGRIDPPATTESQLNGESANCSGASLSTQCAMWAWDERIPGYKPELAIYQTPN